MRKLSLLGGAAVLAAMLAGPVAAQNAPALSYEQPLPPSSIMTGQERLRAARVYAGQADGIWGPDSAAALQRFQQTHQLHVTGQLNQATAATLGLDPVSLLAPNAGATAAVQPADQLRPSSVRAVQSRLAALGFYRGNVDGIWGQSTQDAIQSFQQGRGLQPNGQLNPATVSALGLLPNALAYR